MEKRKIKRSDIVAFTREILNEYVKLIEESGITYIMPNFDEEWMEAQRYPEFVEMGKQGWIDIAKKGKTVSYSSIRKNLGNVDLNFTNLEQPKRERFKKAFETGQIEMPIAVRFSDTDYDLVAGNTRISGLVSKGNDPQIWVVDISHLM